MGVVPVVPMGANGKTLLDVRWLAARVKRAMGAPLVDADTGAIALADAVTVTRGWQTDSVAEPKSVRLPEGWRVGAESKAQSGRRVGSGGGNGLSDAAAVGAGGGGCWRWLRWRLRLTAWASGPRFITGTSGYAVAGVPMAWYTNQVSYFTDPGDLSSTVTHAQADAMVAAAAGMWNIPTASVTLAQGGELAEHVAADGSSPNAYFNGTAVVWPADVEATNYASVQIPVIYDSDGSVIDLLLGGGASDPSGCQQNGVVESVDQFGSSGTIQHAVILLNGLCVSSTDPTVAQEQLTQMQYQLTRVFGRVLGLSWAQSNDGVFTGMAVTVASMTTWPLMHPIDVDLRTVYVPVRAECVCVAVGRYQFAGDVVSGAERGGWEDADEREYGGGVGDGDSFRRARGWSW